MKKTYCWGIKIRRGGFVNYPPREYWEADRTMLFRTKKQAEGWLASNQFWNPKAEVVRVLVTVKEFGA